MSGTTGSGSRRIAIASSLSLLRAAEPNAPATAAAR